MEIDIEKLRNDLIDYFGTAMLIHNYAIVDIMRIENASNEVLIDLANKMNFDLNKYKKDKTYKIN